MLENWSKPGSATWTDASEVEIVFRSGKGDVVVVVGSESKGVATIQKSRSGIGHGPSIFKSLIQSHEQLNARVYELTEGN